MIFHSLRKTLLNSVAKRFGIPQTALAYIKPITVAGRQTKIGLPKDLISLNVLNLIRGIYNTIVFPCYSNWVWPYWVNQQFDSHKLSFIPRGFQIPAMNVANRNWTALGCLHDDKEAIIDPRGLVTAHIDGWSLDVMVVYENKLYAPSQLPSVKQRVLHGIPIIETAFEASNFQILITSFAAPLGNSHGLIHHVTVTNHGQTGHDITILFSVRPYNPEGISLIHHLHFQGNSFAVNGVPGPIFCEKPHSVICSNLKQGDSCLRYLHPVNELDTITDIYCDAGLATGTAAYELFLNPDDQRTLECRIPMDKRYKQPINSYLDKDYPYHLQMQTNLWKAKISSGMSISIPDKKLEKAFRTNMSYMLLFHDGDSITPGPFNYHHFWFRDAAYLLQALMKVGFIDEARQVLLTYPSRQKHNGFFYSQESEWDSNGQAIWAIAEYFRITNDEQTIHKLLPSVYKGAKWIIGMLDKSKDKPAPYTGLMPVGLSAEHFGANDCYYWDDYWALKGLMDARMLLESFPKEKYPLAEIDNTIKELQTNIDGSLTIANKKLSAPMLPISPTRFMDSAAIGSLATLYPLRLFSPFDERLINTVEYLREHCFTNGVFFHDINHSGHGTYLNTHVAQVYLSQRNPKALDIIHWMNQIATQTFTWPESIHPFTFGGVIGDGHHGWAAADFLMMIRNMLFMEEGDNLILFSVIPKDWLSLFETIKVEKAPSYFGLINFSLEVCRPQEYILTLNNHYRETPKAIEVNLPILIDSIECDGHFQSIGSNRFQLTATTKRVRIIPAL